MKNNCLVKLGGTFFFIVDQEIRRTINGSMYEIWLYYNEYSLFYENFIS